MGDAFLPIAGTMAAFPALSSGPGYGLNDLRYQQTQAGSQQGAADDIPSRLVYVVDAIIGPRIVPVNVLVDRAKLPGKLPVFGAYLGKAGVGLLALSLGQGKLGVGAIGHLTAAVRAKGHNLRSPFPGYPARLEV